VVLAESHVIVVGCVCLVIENAVSFVIVKSVCLGNFVGSEGYIEFLSWS
jgi:hypothetical protein